jgi:hypothetical protein
MRSRWLLAPCGALLFLLLFVSMVLPSFASGRPTPGVQPRVLFLPTPTVTVPPSDAASIVVDVLQNMQTNGFDAQANDGLGGLWINWWYGTEPLQTNFDAAGNANGSLFLLQQDRLADLRYVHALWMYKTQHPQDTQFDGELMKYTHIVKAEFSGHPDERGWVFDTLIDLYHLSHDSFYTQTAKAEAMYLDTAHFHRSLGAYCKTSHSHPRGYYPVDEALEAGSALLQAGSLFNHKQWSKDGKTILAFVEQHAFLSHSHVFASYMDNVLLPSGKLNPTETFFRGTDQGGQLINGGQITVGLVGQEILSLLHAYQVTHDETLLDKVQELLAPLRAQPNALGLWDSHHLGYYAALTFPGKSIAHPGTPVLSKQTKQGGQQLLMLEAFEVAGTLTGGTYSSMVLAMEEVAVNKAYYTAGHGYLDKETADWKPLVLQTGDNAGETEDWVTTQAMGIALEALQSEPSPAPNGDFGTPTALPTVGE